MKVLGYSPSVALLVVVCWLPEAAAQGPCTTDAECAAPAVCYAGSCTALAEDQSALRIQLADPSSASSPMLYIDGEVMGTLPWEGIVTPGTHEIRVEAYGMLPAVFQGQSVAGQLDNIPITLEPDPAYAGVAATPASQPGPAGTGDSDWDEKPGRVFVGLFGGGGYGTAQWGTNKTRRPAAKWFGGGALGVYVIDEPVFIDLAFATSYAPMTVKDPPGADPDKLVNGWTVPGRGAGVEFSLQGRVLFPIKPGFFYLGGELEGGYILSSARYAFGGLRLALSLFVNRYVEIRINPIGGEYVQELLGEGFLAFGTATLGVAFRFP